MRHGGELHANAWKAAGPATSRTGKLWWDMGRGVMAQHIRMRRRGSRKATGTRFAAALAAFAMVCAIGSAVTGRYLAGMRNERMAALAQCHRAADALTNDLETLRATMAASQQVTRTESTQGVSGTADAKALHKSQSDARSTLDQPAPQCADKTTTAELTALTHMLTARAGDARSQASALASSSVEAANALNADARTTLAAAASQGQWWLASTDGHVDDESTRTALGTAIDRANALLDGAEIRVDGKPYRDATAALNTAMDAVAASNVSALGVDCAKSACVALTFDDGPSAKTTPTVIDALKRTNTTATFFTVGEHVANDGEGRLTKELADAGYPIENHSWNHADLASLSAGDLRSQLVGTNDAVQKVSGYAPTMIRPPYSSWNDAVRREAIRLNTAIINYDTIGVDWSVGADQVYDKVVRWTHPGSIILLHDIQPSTAGSIERIITTLKARGFVFVSIPQLLGGRPQPGWVYYSRTGHIKPDQPWADSSLFTQQW